MRKYLLPIFLFAASSIGSALIRILTVPWCYAAAAVFICASIAVAIIDTNQKLKSIEGKDKIIEEKDKVITDKDKIITDKDAVISLKDEALREKESEISKMLTTMKREALHDLLIVTRKQVAAVQKNSASTTLRINIMVLKDDKLTILDEVGMSKNDLDKGISFNLGQGCCGSCATANKTKVFDLTMYYADTYEKTLELERNNGCLPFGLKKEQYEHTKDLKSLICSPITEKEDKTKVIAVLGMDDKIPVEESMFCDVSVIHILECCKTLATPYIIDLGGIA